MNLRENPFYILKLPCSADRRDIVAAAEEMSFFQDAAACNVAQNALTNLGKRLTAELEWFVDVNNDELDEIRNAIEETSLIPVDGLKSLSRLNATLFNFSINVKYSFDEIQAAIYDIDAQYDALDAEEIAELINNNRRHAKLALVQQQEVTSELNKKRDTIRQIITEKLSVFDEDTYISLVARLAEEGIADDDNNYGVVLSDIIDQYEIRMQSVIEESTENIEASIENIKRLPDETGTATNIRIKALIRRVQRWDRLVQPIQLKAQASGMPHDISENLGNELRELAVSLHNDKDKTEEALMLVNAMKEIFAELWDLSEKLDKDADILNDLLQGEGEAKEVIDALNAFEQRSKQIVLFSTENLVQEYISQILSLNTRIRALVLEEETETKAREKLCYIARGTAIELHNTKGKTQFAISIIKALLTAFGDIATLRIKLNDDLSVLSRQLLFKNSVRTIPTRPAYTKKRDADSKSGYCGCIFWIIIGVILLIILCTKSCRSDSTENTATTATKTSYYQSTTNASKDEKYTVTFNKCGGTGGTNAVYVNKNSRMPSGTAPKRDGYVFKGYYEKPKGEGTKYYNETMLSAHVWDQNSDATVYAHWEKFVEVEFTQDASVGDQTYADIVSIEPCLGIYTSYGGVGSGIITDVVCKCKTSSGNTVYVYMTTSQYTDYIDSNVSGIDIDLGYFDTVQYSPAKRIRGTARMANAMCDGLSSTTGTMLLLFLSID